MDYPIRIAVCRRKTDRQYVNQTATWSSLRERNRSPVRTPETAAQYQTLSKPERDAAKDQGGFVGGWLRDGLRKNGCVLSRCVGALDADTICGCLGTTGWFVAIAPSPKRIRCSWRERPPILSSRTRLTM